ncbi:hypothetical protein ES705_50134 [subsurface metagenome]
MTLRELLQENKGKYCYPAGVITETTQTEDGKRVDAKLAEIWQISVALLNKEMELR